MVTACVPAWQLAEGDVLSGGGRVLRVHRNVVTREVTLTIDDAGTTQVAVWWAEAPLTLAWRPTDQPRSAGRFARYLGGGRRGRGPAPY